MEQFMVRAYNRRQQRENIGGRPVFPENDGNYGLIIVPPNTPIRHDRRNKLTLDDIQTLVGGYVEVIPHFKTYGSSPCLAFGNEDGKLLALPKNPRATMFWATAWEHLPANEFLVGVIVIVTASTPMLNQLLNGE
jgi:hypothetical protein